ncbi:MAG: hypothetical protein E5Y03_31850 [Mesorhizobium sp.]|uniref:hypothetical protein n=1 Tax=Mesorhizobium sp. TaxID=1871066 RepID=UPI001204ADEA|nr:hypothetical protein [Mesorhizobium sp.]TIN94610.1 MAG: hypothetical protein E5Y03_31850 [Mesorhizobium sp.]
MVNAVIALQTQIKAKHPTTGKPITIVGVDTSTPEPRLIVVHRGPKGIYAEAVDHAEEVPE